MADGENVDVDLYSTWQEAVQAALDTAEEGETLIICRGNWKSCPSGRGDGCEFCARIPWVPGLTAADVLARAASN